jgi:NAD(P)-dependent dehydrogenase (short-subunit alcohol dehydrogenase family)
MQAHGRLDILVNNAGIALGGAPDELDPADWRRVIDINLTGAFLCAAEAFRIMKPQGGGRILNIGSVSSQVPRPNSAPYTASKFGLEGLTRALALDGRPHGIAVSVLHPGNVMTRIWEGRESVAQTEGAIDPDDLAKVALTMVTLPPDINMLHGLILPVSMPFVGRG